MKIISYLLTFAMLFVGVNAWAADDGGSNGGTSGGSTGSGGTTGTGGSGSTGGSDSGKNGSTGNKGGEQSTPTQNTEVEKDGEHHNELAILLLQMCTGNTPVRRAPRNAASTADADVIIQYAEDCLLITFNTDLGMGNISLINTETDEIFEEEVMAVKGQSIFYQINEPGVMKFAAQFHDAEGRVTWEM